MRTVFCIFMISFSSVLSAEGIKGISLNGSIEAGSSYSWQPSHTSGGSTKVTQWLVDDLTLGITADVGDKTRVIISNRASVGGRNASSTVLSTTNSSAFFSSATLNSTNSRLLLSNNQALIDYKCGEGFHMAVGHFEIPFGMESIPHRYDLTSYYYSSASVFGRRAGFYHDTGVKFALSEVIPGSLDFAIIDGRNNSLVTSGSDLTPGLALRYQFQLESGDTRFTPVVSTYLSRFRGSPSDLGASVGAMWRMGMLFGNIEWVYASVLSDATSSASKTSVWSLYAEPGVDLGIIQVSLKAEFSQTKTPSTTSQSDSSLGASISKYYDNFRVRLLYQHLNFSGNSGRPGNDLRILFGTKW